MSPRHAADGFSQEKVRRNMSTIEPYGYNVTYDDGSHASLATRERPKFVSRT